MAERFSKTRLSIHTYSVQAFVKRVIITLSALVVGSVAACLLLIYRPLKSELEKSLVENFQQLSYIRYTSLQNYMDRGLEGARSLSSRTVIRNAILEYQEGKISLNDLAETTQAKYEDGARALEYLLMAERFVDDNLIARYAAEDYTGHVCDAWDGLESSDKISSALCIADDCQYFAIRSPILSQGRVIGYDQLTFDFTSPIHLLCTGTIHSELVCDEEFKQIIANARILPSDEISTLFYKDGIFYQAFHVEEYTHFLTKQYGASLLEPVNRLSKQVLWTGIGILLAFALAVYLFVICYAKNELEDGCISLRYAMSEANTDPLTGAGSRRLGPELLSVAFIGYKSGEPSPAVFLLDIDGLKLINDAHGHSIGDVVIRAVAEAMQKNIRSGDILLRWGGDEFIGVIYGLGKDHAVPFSQKLLQTVTNLHIPVGSDTIRPTISMGISYFEKKDASYIDVINRADRAMYQAKSEGKNRVQLL